jgi:5'-nucleotidase
VRRPDGRRRTPGEARALARPIRAAFLATVIAVGMAAAPIAARGGDDDAVDVQLLAFNDFHGRLQPPSGNDARFGSIEAGGLEYLASHIARLKASNPNTVVVSAGDNIGASPLLSAMFHDEPSIEGLSAAGLQLSAVGNHELDEGWAELYRMQNGGCHPVEGCLDGTGFAGAAFQFLAANIVLDPRRVDPAILSASGWNPGTDRPATLFPPFAVKDVGGVKLGFIGLTLRRAPDLVLATGIRGLTFHAEAKTANEVARTLRRQGVRTIVVLIHEGGSPDGDDGGRCRGMSGEILDIVRAMSRDIDVVISGHTHRAYTCTVGSKLVTSAERYGHAITDIDLRIDRRTGQVKSKTAHNAIVTRDIVDPAAAELVARYRQLASSVSLRRVGSLTANITRDANDAGESALGDLVADSMLEATSSPPTGGAVIALINPGGLREDFVRATEWSSADPAPITYADVFGVLPYSNMLVVKTLSGDQLRRLLEQQFDNPRPGSRAILQVSRGFTYSYDLSRSGGRRVDPATMALDGRPIEPRHLYRIAMPDFLSAGGDRFSVATQGTDAVTAGSDLEALVAFIGAHSPIGPAPGQPPRIRRTR